MVTLITRGRMTHEFAKALVAAPEDREPAVRKLVESVGGKLINLYFTTGDSDILLISETNDVDTFIAGLLAAAAAGTVSDLSTSRAWTSKEFKAIAQKAAKATKGYNPPGKH